MRAEAPCPCSDRFGEGPSVLDLPIPPGLREEWRRLETRRHFLGRVGKAFGWAGLASLLGERLGAVGAPDFAPRAKRGIYLFMSGGPPQLDLWDYKPGLARLYDQDLPPSVRGEQVLTGMTAGQDRFPVAPSRFKFTRHGKSGRWVSEVIPWTARVVDELTLIHSLNTDAINHVPAALLMNTGNMNAGKPCIGSWLAYGLGSINENLPTFVVLTSQVLPKQNNQPLSSRYWSSGFFPSEYGAVTLRSGGDPVLYLRDPAGLTREGRRALIDAVNEINRATYEEMGDPEIQTSISEYEMAFRMQASVPDLTDMRGEPASTWELYGPEAKLPGTFAYNCLLARRMAERGVRFTQIYQRGWDFHTDLVPRLPDICQATDRPTYALITDLKQRGMLDDTLVVWGGEFGRTVYSQGGLSKDNYGRDHHPRCFTVWMAGGGAKPGIAYGKTDDYSYNIVENPVPVRDFHATLLHLFGLDNNKLTYRYQGLDQKLTGVLAARPVTEILA